MNYRNWRLSLLTIISLTAFPLYATDDNLQHEEHDHIGNDLSLDGSGHREDLLDHAEGEHDALIPGGKVHDEEGHEGHEHDEHSQEDTGHDDHGHGGEHEDKGVVELNKQQRETAGIVVMKLDKRVLPVEALALGETTLNSYATSQMGPRIEGQVVKRHARLGDHVKKGQALVTLSSVAMAEAQANALITAKEWQRVSKLGRKVVSERRYLEAQIAFQQARATLLAYGMTARQADKLISSNSIKGADGRYTLNALQDGVVIKDDFILGQMAEPGQLLFEITDESELWVEARANPDAIQGLKVGAPARVQIAGQWIDAEVIQVHHTLDEVTRTIAVRLKIANPDDQYHPGQFVTASIRVGNEDRGIIAVPVNAVLRSPDGDWQVFVEEQPGRFEAREVDVVRQVSGLAVIQGLPVGTAVVTEGAFFVQSEQAKSGFDVHNH